MDRSRLITDDIDLNGWDLRKALRLFARTNPPAVEWNLIDDDRAPLADIHDLLRRKRMEPEMGLSRPVASIHAFIEAELERIHDVQAGSGIAVHGMSARDELFRNLLDACDRG